MNTTEKRRILQTAPVAIALVLSVAACGSPFKSGASGAPAPSDTSSGAVLSTGATGSNGTGTTSSSGTSGGSSFGSTGGSTSGGSAVGGQGGVSSGGSAAVGSATPGQAGAANGGFGNSTAASGMSPDQVALYCTSFSDLTDPSNDYSVSSQLEALTSMRKATPVQLAPNVDAMISDYQSIRDEKRVYAQLKDELVTNYGPLKDLNQQICIAH